MKPGRLAPPPAVTEALVTLGINGQPRRLLLDVRTTLLEVLRVHLGLTGTKLGCDHGNCGACTVLIDGRAQYSCMRLAVDCDDVAITTIEALAGSELTPVQQAFIDQDALQCGFCTPGQVLSATSLLRRVPEPTPEQLVQGMSGNLCRCGAYRNIRAAVAQAARVEAG